MSISIPSFAVNPPDYAAGQPTDQAAPTAKPSVSQQMHTLATSGQSAQQIATSLGLPTSEVNAALGITTSPSGTATAVVAAAARLSVHA
ncbi:hypothetical protein [Granulicella tundricola]|uniref:Uncharacterized protein n=1 Tax=Granulicella tundricola (strain ATCC BAA-1859 / DSM 23138 / MP5ACTX9) TaxID=1198114 RepID=E8X0N4_GRATM|nr:hypothetical protein [Granulicella tundricola]ADW68985.1 hypothetical protein AciX9_1939 [Granulicella tundricola MP5ACTX9]